MQIFPEASFSIETCYRNIGHFFLSIFWLVYLKYFFKGTNWYTSGRKICESVNTKWTSNTKQHRKSFLWRRQMWSKRTTIKKSLRKNKRRFRHKFPITVFSANHFSRTSLWFSTKFSQKFSWLKLTWSLEGNIEECSFILKLDFWIFDRRLKS